MKAIVWTKYGSADGLELREVQKPTPGDHEVLIRVCATTVTAGDCELRSLKLPLLFRLPMQIYVGLSRPKRVTILGQELAGTVEAVGKHVKRFKVGDPVFGTTGLGFGAYAEYKCLPEEGVLTVKPASMTHEQAAAVPVGGLEALHFIRKASIESGQKVLIRGAGGSIGTWAVQLARNLGAQVTAVDSTGKIDMLRSLGAERVIDYTREDFTENGETYHVIFDVVGNSSFSRCVKALDENGRYLVVNPRLSDMVQGQWTGMTSSKRVILGAANQRREDLVFLKELIEAGKIKSVIDRCYPLEQVAEAHRYVETGNKIGNVVIALDH